MICIYTVLILVSFTPAGINITLKICSSRYRIAIQGAGTSFVSATAVVPGGDGPVLLALDREQTSKDTLQTGQDAESIKAEYEQTGCDVIAAMPSQ